LNDQEIIAGIRNGDAEAKRALFDAEAARVWSLVFRLTQDYDATQDVTQETFLTAFRKIDGFRGTGSFRGWLCRIALNLARDAMRASRRRELRTVSLESVGEQLRAATVPDDAFGPRLHLAVLRLSVPLRTVLLMHDIEEYTHEEIAVAIGIAVGSSRARLSRARAIMREILVTREDQR
jgi:RNA polymerase sigma-70 factor, ECF subfamily